MSDTQARIKALQAQHKREVAAESLRKAEALRAQRKADADAFSKTRSEKLEADLDRRTRAKAFSIPGMSEAEFKTIGPELRRKIMLEDIAENDRQTKQAQYSRMRRAF